MLKLRSGNRDTLFVALNIIGYGGAVLAACWFFMQMKKYKKRQRA